MIEKKAGLKLLENFVTWIGENGIVAICVPTFSDIRYKNFKSFGATLQEALGEYKFQEITPGCLKVDPPIPCSEGCAHEYFSFYHPSEIRQKFSGFKEYIDFVSEDEEGHVTFFYIVQKKI